MKLIKYLILSILGFLCLCKPSYSQILFEDACSSNSITSNEKEIIKNTGFVIRSKQTYNKDFASKREKKNGISKIGKYIDCELKVIYNDLEYQIFTIGDVLRYHPDGSIESEEKFDSTGYNLSEISYGDLSKGHYKNEEIKYSHLLKGDTLYLKEDYKYYYENGNIRIKGTRIWTCTKTKHGIWFKRKSFNIGPFIIYKPNGEIKDEKYFKERMTKEKFI